MTTNSNTETWGEEQTHFFYQLTPELIMQSVERFGLRCTGRCSALNSMENRVYEIEVEPRDSEGEDSAMIIAKFYRPGRWTKQQILTEHNYLKKLNDHEIPVIAPTAGQNQQTLLEIEGEKIFFCIFPKQGGRSPDELSSEECQIVGRLIARMHNVGRTLNADNRVKLNPASYGLNYIDYFRKSQLIHEPIKGTICGVTEQICQLIAPMFDDTQTHAIHGDAHLGNLLNGRDGFFWVDFDDMVVGPPVQDLWLLLPGRDEFAKEKLGHLLIGYEQMRPFDRSSLRLIEPLRALRMIHFAAWIGIRWQDPAFPRAFPFYCEPSYWQNLIFDLQQSLIFIQGGDYEFSWF